MYILLLYSKKAHYNCPDLLHVQVGVTELSCRLINGGGGGYFF